MLKKFPILGLVSILTIMLSFGASALETKIGFTDENGFIEETIFDEDSPAEKYLETVIIPREENRKLSSIPPEVRNPLRTREPQRAEKGARSEKATR